MPRLPSIIDCIFVQQFCGFRDLSRMFIALYTLTLIGIDASNT